MATTPRLDPAHLEGCRETRGCGPGTAGRNPPGSTLNAAADPRFPLADRCPAPAAAPDVASFGCDSPKPGNGLGTRSPRLAINAANGLRPKLRIFAQRAAPSRAVEVRCTRCRPLPTPPARADVLQASLWHAAGTRLNATGTASHHWKFMPPRCRPGYRLRAGSARHRSLGPRVDHRRARRFQWRVLLRCRSAAPFLEAPRGTAVAHLFAHRAQSRMREPGVGACLHADGRGVSTMTFVWGH